MHFVNIYLYLYYNNNKKHKNKAVVKGLYGKKCIDTNEIIKNSEDICIYILRVSGVALVPGIAFGDDDAVRIAFAVSMQM